MPGGTTCADTSIIRKKRKKKNGAFVNVWCLIFYDTVLVCPHLKRINGGGTKKKGGGTHV